MFLYWTVHFWNGIRSFVRILYFDYVILEMLQKIVKIVNLDSVLLEWNSKLDLCPFMWLPNGLIQSSNYVR